MAAESHRRQAAGVELEILDENGRKSRPPRRRRRPTSHDERRGACRGLAGGRVRACRLSTRKSTWRGVANGGNAANSQGAGGRQRDRRTAKGTRTASERRSAAQGERGGGVRNSAPEARQTPMSVYVQCAARVRYRRSGMRIPVRYCPSVMRLAQGLIHDHDTLTSSSSCSAGRSRPASPARCCRSARSGAAPRRDT